MSEEQTKIEDPGVVEQNSVTEVSVVQQVDSKAESSSSSNEVESTQEDASSVLPSSVGQDLMQLALGIDTRKERDLFISNYVC